MVGERAAARADEWSFCTTAACPTAYYAGETEIARDAVRVPIFQKESAEDRLVCYCFDHSVRDVRAATRADATNAIVEEIMQACRRGLDRCEKTNPQGRCCLGNVRALLRPAADEEECPSCAGEET